MDILKGFNFPDVTALLGKVADSIELLNPFTGALGIADKVIDLGKSAIDIGKNVMDRVEDGKVIVNSQDKMELSGVIARLEAQNKELDNYIRGH